MNKTLLTIFKVVLHVIGWPVLFALVYLLNRDVIAGGKMYGISVYVCFIFTAVMAIVYYLTYFLVRTRKKRSIRNQHVIIAIVAVCCLSGIWMLMDAFIPEPLATATSNTLYWEDLSDNWAARADVNEKLLSDYVTINYNLGRLESPNGETIEDYIKQGPNGNQELKALLEADFHSIDGDGYASYRTVSIDYAQSGRMTVPVLLHLFLDDRSYAQGANTDYAKEKNLPELQIAVPYYTIYNTSDTVNAIKDKDGNPLEVRIYHGYNSEKRSAFFVTDNKLNTMTFADPVDPETKVDYLEKVAVISHKGGEWVLVAKIVDKGKTVIREQYTYETREDAIAALTNFKYYRTLEDGKKKELTTSFDMFFEGNYKQASVGWHVLDMLGEGMEMSLLSEEVTEIDIAAIVEGMDMGEIGTGLKKALNNYNIKTVASLLQLDLVPDALTLVADLAAEDAILGSPIYITLDAETGMLSLQPSNESRGTLGYMQMAWLNSQGLLYIIVSLFSLRTLYYAFGPYMAIIAILLGLIREKESQLKGQETGAPAKTKKEKKGKKKDADAVAAADLVEDTSTVATEIVEE